MAIEVRCFHHVQLTVPPEAETASIAFYKDIIGLTEIDKPAPLKSNGGAWFRHGGVEIHISVEAGESDNQASKRHVCFEVADLAQTQAALLAAGLEIIADKQPIAGWPRFYVRDPGGNRLEFTQQDMT